MALLTSRDRVPFWPAEQVAALNSQIPVLRDERRDQRSRWPARDAPDWGTIIAELAASRSAYFRHRKGDGREHIDILTGRLILLADVSTNRTGQQRLWVSGSGIRFASNSDRRPFLAYGRPVRHDGIVIVSASEFRQRFEAHRTFATGNFIGNIRAALANTAQEPDHPPSTDDQEPEAVTSESELHLLRALDTFVEAEYEMDEQAARALPAFTFLEVRPEPRRTTVKQFVRFRLVEEDHRRLLESATQVKMLAFESVDGNRMIFEIDDLEPTPAKPEIVLATSDQSGAADLPQSGRLISVAIDTLLKLRKQVIDDLRFGRAANPWLVSVAAGTRPLIPFSQRPYTPPDSAFAPNPSQVEAIAKGLSTEDYLLVLGPPGTGKTTVINSWVDELVVKEGKQVLITSQNNKAVDNVLERVALDKRFTCIRVGRESKVSSKVRDLLIDNCAAELQRTLLTDVDDRLAGAEQLRNALVEAVKHLAVEDEQAQPAPHLKYLSECLSQQSGRLAEALGLNTAAAMDGAQELVGLSDARQTEQREEDERRAQGGWGWLLHRWKAFQHRRRGRALERQLAQKMTDLRTQLSEQLARMEGAIGIIRGWHGALTGARQQSLYPLLLRLVDVVGATCMSINTDRLFKDTTYDVVIADESGQIQLQNLMVPMSKGRRVILVGDHKQLPPVVADELRNEVLQRAEVQQLPLPMDLLTKSWFEVMWPLTPAERRVMLNTQFRCPSVISDFISEAFYDGAYFASPAMEAKKPLLDDFTSTMVFIDTSGLPDHQRGERSGSLDGRLEVLGNRCEAEIIMDVLHLFATRLPKLARSGEVGIIVPYKKHVAEVLQLLERARRRGLFQELRPPLSELVASVDSFQGQERDLIIHAFTRSNRSATVGFLKDWRRLNVAMTRAKRQLILIGDFSTLAAPTRADASDAAFKQSMSLLQRHVRTRGQLICAVDWLARMQAVSP